MSSWYQSPVFEFGKNILLKKYPDFVYGKALHDKEIPVFCLHSISGDKFESILKYLSDNEYHTLSVADAYWMLKGKIEGPSKKVMLTFDDGQGSLWTIAYPLLRKYGHVATAFIVPGIVEQREKYYPNLIDVWNGKALFDEIANRESKKQPFVTWEEITEMSASGTIDFQSHSYMHELIYTSPNIVNFLHGSLIARYSHFEIQSFISQKQKNSAYIEDMLGMPLYESSPRMSGKLRFIDSEIVRDKCINHVRRNGGESFFTREGWQKDLMNIVRNCPSYHKKNNSFETQRERNAAIEYSLAKSKEILEKRLVESEAAHFCYPWGIGSDLAVQLSKKVGYLSNFWGKATHKLCNQIVHDTYRINRIGEDFIFMLPGNGRKTLSGLLVKKLLKFLKYGSPYLTH
jgi:peptidoglycan/xylan/chitin deacetylase (PgdA/CDA1 family)